MIIECMDVLVTGPPGVVTALIRELRADGLDVTQGRRGRVPLDGPACGRTSQLLVVRAGDRDRRAGRTERVAVPTPDVLHQYQGDG